MLIWFTGLSGSGKTTLARALEERIHHIGKKPFVLDGDEVRRGLCSDLGYSMGDRAENIRRISEVAKLFVDAGFITLAAFISPAESDRRRVRRLFGDNFMEVFVRCPIEVCEARDIKGLYKKARSGQIPNFTGISSVYEEPECPELIIDTEIKSVTECINDLLTYLADRGVIDTAENQDRADRW